VKRYRVMLLREMSQVVEVEASSVAHAVNLAVERHDLNVNISNNFDESGDVDPYNVTDADTDDVLWTSKGPQDGSWEEA
jgi:hypothetical protein